PIPRDTPIAVYCQGGTRSAIAASLLQAKGFTKIANVTGGIGAWMGAVLPVDQESFGSHREPSPAPDHCIRIRSSTVPHTDSCRRRPAPKGDGAAERRGSGGRSWSSEIV